MEKKKIILYVALLAAIIIGGIFIVNNFTKEEVNSDNPEFASYVLAYTSGVISKTSVIKIQLTDEIVDNLNKKNKLPKRLLNFKPKIKGKFSLNGDMLEFKPDENMPSDKEYFAVFNLGRTTKVKEELQDFKFRFKTIAQAFDFAVEEQKTTDRKTLKYQQITGVTETADSETKKKYFKSF